MVTNRLRKRLALLTCFAMSVLLLFGEEATSADSTRPHILLIMVDDMGFGDPGCFNAESKIATPNIDSLAIDGMRFLDAHAPGPLCHMSRYGLMTGRYPFRTDVGVWRKQPLIDADQTTIASLLQRQGYRTAMVGKWHLGFDENGYDKPLPGGPVDVGFDSFFGIRASTDIPPYFYIRGDQAVAPPTQSLSARRSPGWSPIQGEFWRSGLIAKDMELKDVLPRFTDEAVATLDKHHAAHPNQPLFMYLAYPAPHTPWLPSPEFVGRSKVSMYGDFVEMVDAMVGRVLKRLDDHGMAENTMVVFTSDNGPVWYETDVERFGHDAAGGLRGMKSDAWEAGHRMPFIVRWPTTVAAGSSTQQTICFTDLLATFASITGTELKHSDGPDSFDFSTVLNGKREDTNPVRAALPIRSGGGMMTIREGKWKLIQGLGSGGFSQPRRLKPEAGQPAGQLYDLSSDPQETQNLYLRHAEIVSRLEDTLEKIVTSGRHRQGRHRE